MNREPALFCLMLPDDPGGSAVDNHAAGQDNIVHAARATDQEAVHLDNGIARLGCGEVGGQVSHKG